MEARTRTDAIEEKARGVKGEGDDDNDGNDNDTALMDLLEQHPVSDEAWPALDAYMAHCRYWITHHQLHAYNDFVHHNMRQTISSYNRGGKFKVSKEDAQTMGKGDRKIDIEVFVGGDEEASGVYIDRPTLVEDVNGDPLPPSHAGEGEDPAENGTRTRTGGGGGGGGASEERARLMFPNDARLRDLTYASSVYADILFVFSVNGTVVGQKMFPRQRIAQLPVMLHSDACVLNRQSPDALREMGECPYDQGGYFIVGGKEKVLVSRERQVHNRLLIDKMVGRDEAIFDKDLSISQQKPADDGIEYRARVQCMDRSLESMFPKQVYFKVYGLRSGPKAKRNTVELTFAGLSDAGGDGGKLSVPLFVIFRALGVETDREIATLVKGGGGGGGAATASHNISRVDAILHACAASSARLRVFDQMAAVNYLTPFTRYKSVDHLKQLLLVDVFPNAGPDLMNKARYLAFVVRKLLNVATGAERPTNRDSYEHKRVDVPGSKIANLFRDKYLLFMNRTKNSLNSEYAYAPWRRTQAHEEQAEGGEGGGGGEDADDGEEGGLSPQEQALSLFQARHGDVLNIVTSANVRRIVNDEPLNDGILSSFRGAWNVDDPGAALEKWEKEDGVVQELNRLSFLMYASHVRRVTAGIDMEKYIPPHLLYPRQLGAVCPVESPDGPNIGITKHLAMLCHISQQIDVDPLLEHLLRFGMFARDTSTGITPTPTLSPASTTTVLIANDILEGVVMLHPATLERYLLSLRRNGLLHPLTSIRWEPTRGEIVIFTDAGRCVRPLFIVDHEEPPEVPGRLNRPGVLRVVALRDRRGKQRNGTDWRSLVMGVENAEDPHNSGVMSDVGFMNHVLNPWGAFEVHLRDLSVRVDAAAATAAQAAAPATTPTAPLENAVLACTADLSATAGAIEFVDQEEANARLLAMSVVDLRRVPCQKYTHCEIHPASLLGIPTACMPMMHHNQATRGVLSMAQSKQSIGVSVTNFANRMDTMGAVLHYPQRPLVTTGFAHRLNHGNLAYGENAIVAIASYSGYNQEDAVILNADAVARGMFNITVTHTSKFEEAQHDAEEIVIAHPLQHARSEDRKRQIRDAIEAPGHRHGRQKGGYGDDDADGDDERIVLRKEEEEAGGEGGGEGDGEGEGRREASSDGSLYHLLDEAGLPVKDRYVAPGDVILGRIHTRTDVHREEDAIGMTSVRKSQTTSDKSVKTDEGGFVDRVFVFQDGPGAPRRCKIRIRHDRQPEFGDKFASRHSQKGVVGMMLPAAEMPFAADSGIVPDVIINPHAFPSRMVVGHLLECLLSKGCVHEGSRIEATTFERNPATTEERQERLLARHGMHPHGQEVMYNGRTGEQIPASIFFGPTYYMRLKHMVADKINHRSTTGPRTALTRQPNKGRSNHGGLRVGEMETHAMLSHGMGAFLKESLMERSDKHAVVVDADSGLHAAHVAPQGRRIPAVDIASGDGGPDARHILPMGGGAADLRTVEVPYSFKLMQQELRAIGIDTRLMVDGEGDDAPPRINSEVERVFGLGECAHELE